ncbi:hypothetical protein CSAL01_01459 [Colletotrichum salicis]|uniref:Uncharacterized protein n=1 Tax=Colletotrichum salicis TaxID=1209931 RepID=A0A135V9D9_9PEZI|nr:hypothetical protein CSAL01_01459 [Colletotrichum salicis]
MRPRDLDTDYSDDDGWSEAASYIRKSGPGRTYEEDYEDRRRKDRVPHVSISHDVQTIRGNSTARRPAQPPPPPALRQQDSGPNGSRRVSYFHPQDNDRYQQYPPIYPPAYPPPPETTYNDRRPQPPSRRQSGYQQDGTDRLEHGNRNRQPHRPLTMPIPGPRDDERTDYEYTVSRYRVAPSSMAPRRRNSRFSTRARDGREESSSGETSSIEDDQDIIEVLKERLEAYERVGRDEAITKRVKKETERAMQRKILQTKQEEERKQELLHQTRTEAMFRERMRIESEAQDDREKKEAELLQTSVIERRIRDKLEAEKWAEEAEKKAKARQSEEFASLSRAKMMEAMEDVAALTKQKVMDGITNERQIALAKQGEHDLMMSELLAEIRTVIKSDLRAEIRAEIREEMEDEEYEERTGRARPPKWRYGNGSPSPDYATSPDPPLRPAYSDRRREASWGTGYQNPRFRNPRNGRPSVPMVPLSDEDSSRDDDQDTDSQISISSVPLSQPTPRQRRDRKFRRERQMPFYYEYSEGQATNLTDLPMHRSTRRQSGNSNAARKWNQIPEKKRLIEKKNRETKGRGLIIEIPTPLNSLASTIIRPVESKSVVESESNPDETMEDGQKEPEDVELLDDMETRSISPTDSAYQTPMSEVHEL